MVYLELMQCVYKKIFSFKPVIIIIIITQIK